MKKKIFLGVALLIGILAVSGRAKAVEFESRILQGTDESLASKELIKEMTYTQTGTIESSNKVENYAYYTNPSATVVLINDNVSKSHNLFCTNKEWKIGHQVYYKGDGKIHTYTNDLGAWILSEFENDRKYLGEGEVQKAIWHWWGDTEIDKNVVYKTAEVFEEYRKYTRKIGQPSITAYAHSKSTAEGTGIKVGPFKLTYPSAKYGGTQFGNIIDCKIFDGNGNEIAKSRYVFKYEDGQVVSYPENGKDFYIAFTSADVPGPISLKLYFNDIEATGHYVELSGGYRVPEQHYCFYCDDCEKRKKDCLVANGMAYKNRWAYLKCGDYKRVTCDYGCTHIISYHCGVKRQYSFTGYQSIPCIGCSTYSYVSYANHQGPVGCGKTIRLGTYITYKENEPGIRSVKCGKQIDITEHNTSSQPLICAWGERKVSTGVLSVSVELNVIDLSLRKFISEVNGIAVGVTRDPNVSPNRIDTSPLNKRSNYDLGSSIDESIYGPRDEVLGSSIVFEEKEKTTIINTEPISKIHEIEDTKQETHVEYPEKVMMEINDIRQVAENAGESIDVNEIENGIPLEDAKILDTDTKLGYYTGSGTWKSNSTGYWFVTGTDSNGADIYLVNEWLRNDGKYYYFNSNGYMVTGTQTIDGNSCTFSTAAETIGALTNGWMYDGTGWSYMSSGSWVTGWNSIGGSYYYFNSSAYMLTGWQAINGSTYYLGANGKMVTGWNSIGGYWYYFNSDGQMQTGWQNITDGSSDTTKYWFYLGSDGKMATGWQTINGNTYYLGSNGKMVTGWQQIGSYWYYFDSEGHMTKGWAEVSYNNVKNWYYFDSNGHMVTGWQTIDDHKYYFDGSGIMVKGWQQLNNAWYCFSEYGPLIQGWHSENDTWYYLDPDANGKMVTGWKQVDNHWYYFDGSGKMLYDCWVGDYYLTPTGSMLVNDWVLWNDVYYFCGADGKYARNAFGTWQGNTYYFDGNGQMVTDWQKINNKWYYFGETGAMSKNCWIDSKYYVGNDGAMVENDWVAWDGEYYYCGADGIYYKDGWKTIGSGRYYFDKSGAAAIDWNYLVAPNGRSYWFYFATSNSEFSGFRTCQMVTGRRLIPYNGYKAYFYLCETDSSVAGYVQGAMIYSTTYGGHTYTASGAEEGTPVPETDEFKITATYVHPKTPVDVARGDIVTYTIRVYNEGPDLDSYAAQVTDYLPDYLEYIDNDFNRSYGWSASGKTVTTSYLSNKVIGKYVIGSGDLKYADVKIQCRVADNTPRDTVMVNKAEISKYGYVNGGVRYEVDTDRDSTAKNINLSSYNPPADNSKYQEDDDDYEQVKLTIIEDLALRKFITAVNGEDPTIDEVKSTRTPVVNATALNSGVNRTPATATYTHTKSPVDVKRGDIVTYTIRVYNEGSDLNAYAREIKDYLPDYLEYVDNDFNRGYGWSASGKVVTTRYLQNTKLNKYVIGSNNLSYADVKIQCRIASNTPYYQVMVNKAEISKYAHEKTNGTIYESNMDRDSTANNININNYNPPTDNSRYQEDDDDYEQVKLMLTEFNGKIWLDGKEGKESEQDGKLTSRDSLYKEAIVTLHRVTKGDTRTYAATNGTYKFDRLQIKDNYYISFEYQGQPYIPVAVTELSSGNYKSENSAAAERGTSRADLNAKFYEIIPGSSENKGFAVNKNNSNSTIALEYAHDATKRESLINKRTTTFMNASKIQASTVQFKGDAAYTGYINLGLMERAQANLGIMSDINAVDLTINGDRITYDYTKENAMVRVSGNRTAREKLQRNEDSASNMTIKLGDFERVYTQALYASDYNFKIDDYKDYEGKLDPTKTTDRELEAYITYKIKVKNYSAKPASVSKLRIYYDNYAFKYFGKTYDAYNNNIVDLKNNNSWYKKGNTQGTVTWEQVVQDKYSGYSAMTASTVDVNGKLKDITLAAGEEMYIYVRFQAKRNNETRNGIEVNRTFASGSRYIVAEIAAYTTPDGLIDENSQPDNVNLSNLWESYKNTMEDDTDRAPGLNLSADVGAIRKMTGFVFDDALTTTDSSGIKHGDGVFDASKDIPTSGATVQLIELVNINGKTYEYIWQEAVTGNKYVKYMDKNGTLYSNRDSKDVGAVDEGYYRFIEYIPGTYIVRFKYGDNVLRDQVVLSGQDYKSTTKKGFGDNYSSAEDNMYRRYDVMQYSKEQSFIKSAILSNNKKQIENITQAEMDNYLNNVATATEREAVNPNNNLSIVQIAQNILKYNTWMNADTSQFNVSISQTTPGHKINLGVEKRPIAELQAIKKISQLKITNKGLIIVDTTSGIGQQLVAPYKEESFELDDELINGAIATITYDISIKNVGEKDTLYNYFKGNTLGGKLNGLDQNEYIKTTALLLFDYPQNIGFSDTLEENSSWRKATDTEKQNLSQVVQANIKNGKNVTVLIPTNNTLYKDLAVGEETGTISLTLSRILAIGSDDDLLYNNMIEILAMKNPIGRRAAQSVFGNYKPINTNGSLKTNITEPDSDATTVMITDPQGIKTKPHYEIWIASCAILIVGIVLIKAVVLRKNKEK